MFVRDQVARPYLGKDADRWMGLLLTLFFSCCRNLMGVIPFIQFPVTSQIAFPAVLAISSTCSWSTWASSTRVRSATSRT